MSEQQRVSEVGELALKVWDLLRAAYRRRDGAQSVTDMMLASDLGRAEITFGLRELAQGGWVVRTVGEENGRIAERRQVVVRESARGTRGQRQIEAAE